MFQRKYVTKSTSQGPLQYDAKMNKLNLTKLFTADMSRKYVSAQLDFSDSLLEGLGTLSSSIGKETLPIGNEVNFYCIILYNIV